MKLITYEAVLGFIQDQTKLIDVSSERNRLKRLIHLAAMNVTTHNYLVLRSAQVSIENGIGELPCDLVRILRVRTNDPGGNPNNISEDRRDGSISWSRVGNQYIKPSILSGEVKVYYYAMPMMSDSKGEDVPAILPEMMKYCGYYAIKTVFRDDWMEGKMPGDRFSYWDQETDYAYNKAKGSTNLISIDEMDSALWMARNAQFYPQ